MEQHFKTEWHGLVACFRAKLQAGGADVYKRQQPRSLNKVFNPSPAATATKPISSVGSTGSKV